MNTTYSPETSAEFYKEILAIEMANTKEKALKAGQKYISRGNWLRQKGGQLSNSMKLVLLIGKK